MLNSAATIWHNLFIIFTCSSVRSTIGCSVDICSTMDLHGLQGENLLPHSLHHGLKGHLYFRAWTTCSFFFFFSNLVLCRAVALTSSHSISDAAQQFFTLSQMCYHRSPPSIAAGQQEVHLGVTGIISVPNGSSSQCSVTKSCCCSTLLPKPHHTNQLQRVSWR